jgi:anti-sigma-K factor RskA
MRNAGIWTAAVVSAALAMALGPASEASAAPVTLVVAMHGDDSAAGTGFDADTSGGTATLTANLSIADARASALGSATVSSGNSWDLGGTWNSSSVLSTDPTAITGARATDGSLPTAPTFLVPRNGAKIGTRF